MAAEKEANQIISPENESVRSGPIVVCRCAEGKILPSDSVAGICDRLASDGRQFSVVSDLCKLAAKKDPLLAELASAGGLTVVACFPRVVRWLFHSAGATLGPDVKLLNLRTGRTDQIEAELARSSSAGGEDDPSPAVSFSSTMSDNYDREWIAWFPVVDYDRCRNCKQCMNFCLFGVYNLDDAGKICVANPRGCKTNCPACARMCPHGAIMFPKFGQPPINGQDVPPDWKPSEESDRLAGMTGCDLMTALRLRGIFSEDQPGRTEDAG